MDTTFSFSSYPEERCSHGFPWHPEKVRVGPALFFLGATPLMRLFKHQVRGKLRCSLGKGCVRS